MYFDNKSGLLVRLVRWNATPVGPVPTEINYDDYRDVAGVKMPFTWTVSQTYMQMTIKLNAIQANVPVDWEIPLRDHDHVFLKGHRLMVQVQSTWFPIIDRNPQKFVPSIYQATAADYQKATLRVYCGSSPASRILLPVVQ